MTIDITAPGGSWEDFKAECAERDSASRRKMEQRRADFRAKEEARWPVAEGILRAVRRGEMNLFGAFSSVGSAPMGEGVLPGFFSHEARWITPDTVRRAVTRGTPYATIDTAQVAHMVALWNVLLWDEDERQDGADGRHLLWCLRRDGERGVKMAIKVHLPRGFGDGRYEASRMHEWPITVKVAGL